MTLVTDNWSANLNPTPKPLQMFKTLSVTAVSGEAITDTGAFYTKNCPFPIKVTGFEVQCVSVVASGFAGSGSAMTVKLQSSDEVDVSPGSPTAVSWDNIVNLDASGSVSDTDKMLFSAPSNAGDRIDASMDQTYVAVPKGGSLRATLSAQAYDAIGVGFSTPVELLVIVDYVPTALKEQLYN